MYLAAVSKFILNAYDFGDATAPATSLPTEPPPNGDDQTASQTRERSDSVAGPHNQPYLSKSLVFSPLMTDLATFRMVVLADELLEHFFDKDLALSFRLEKTEDEDYHKTHSKPDGILGGLMNLVVNNE